MSSTYRLEDNAIEKSTYVITVAFKDENGTAITPKTLTWTLSDKKGRIINSRDTVTVVTPASSENIVLSNNDLALANNDNRVRVLTVEATFDSLEYGNDLPLKESAEFVIQNLLKVS
jgi:hypothetical protein